MPRTYVAPPTGPHVAFAMRFRAACEAAQMPSTLKGLARVFGVAPPTVHDWRHGEKLPSAEMMAVIAEKTRTNFDWLATGRGTESPPPNRQILELAARIDRAPADVQDYIRAILAASEHRRHPPA